MRFLQKIKVKNRRTIWLTVAALLFVGGLYLLVTALAPTLPPPSQPETKTQEYLATEPAKSENRVFIPAIGVDVLIVEGNSAAVLEKGAWHRRPQNGDPEKGGNFILSAHRFRLGFTPQQTRARSPFYHIDKLEPGEKIYVDWNGKRYAYEITRKYKVDRTAVEIEAPSTEPKLTLYSCDLRGEAAGREVIEAKPIEQ